MMLQQQYSSFIILIVLVYIVQGLDFKFTPGGDLNDDFCESVGPVNSKIYTLNTTGNIGSVKYTCSSADFLYYVEVYENGDIFLRNKFDREANSNFVVNLQATDDAGNIISGLGRVSISDANDNYPVFSEPSYLFDAYEHPWTEKTLGDVSASDRDSGYAGSVVLSLDSSSKFVLSGTSDSSTIQLKDGESLDFEESPVVKETLYAADRGLPECGDHIILTANASMVINVRDGPDRAPVFPTAVYPASLKEGNYSKFTVLTVAARDGDFGLNWKMNYQLVGSAKSMAGFTVDPTSGDVIAEGEVDREAPESVNNGGQFTFTVTATEVIEPPFDNMTNTEDLPMSADVTVTITIADINDNLPVFYELPDPTDTSTKIKKSFFTTEMDEGTSNFVAVPGLAIFVQDLDGAGNNGFTLSLSKGGDIFQVTPERASLETIVTLQVKDSEKLDYEDTKFVEIEIVATEDGSGNEKVLATVNITLKDINDHSPEFDNPTLKVDVSEDTGIGEKIAQFQATDKDSGNNSKISYSFPDDPELFAIDRDTGNVTLQGQLDREMTSAYYVTVRATDGGNRLTQALLEITVTDVNDNAPQFQRSSFSAVLPEDSTAFSFKFLIYATDADQANNPNSMVTYSIISGDVFDNFDFVQPDENQAEGEMIVTKPVDIELFDPAEISCDSGGVATIALVVMAQDNGSTPLNSTVDVTITVEDVNDFAPKFMANQSHANVSEKSAYGTEVFKIVATDGDACGPNNVVDYSISLTEGNSSSSNVFFIETVTKDGTYTGVLKVKDPQLDRDDGSVYEVVIIAEDRADPRESASTTVTVTVNDVNDKPPQLGFLDPTAVPEDAEIDSEVNTAIKATDLDSDSDLVYGIFSVLCLDENAVEVSENCSGRFKVETRDQVGVLVVAIELDREYVATYVITINVTDMNAMEGSIPGFQTAYGEITVTITDVNDCAPVFKDNFNLNVNEGEANAAVGTVSATDADIGENAEIEYLVDDASAQWIQIADPRTGLITTSSSKIDREAMSDVVNVTLIARNTADPPLESKQVFSVRINDVNDNDPVFLTPSNQTIEVLENTGPGIAIFQVNATDADLGVNAELTYSLVAEQSDGGFDVDRAGWIVTYGLLDRETKPSQQVTVQVRDGGGSPRTAVLTLTVVILDEDDSKPMYNDNREQSMAVVEEAQDELVGLVTEADDDDSPENQNNFYFIVGGSGKDYFTIKNGTRELYVTRALDREVEDSYDLVVETTNNASFVPPDGAQNWVDVSDKLSKLRVLIDVTDINDNAPVFAKTQYETDIPYDIQPGERTVYQVEATDADSGQNAEIEYLIDHTTWTLNNQENPVSNIFGITPSRDGKKGDITLNGAIETDQDGFYLIYVWARDEDVNHVGETKVKVGIVSSDETVILDSIYTPEEFSGMKEQFVVDLEEVLGAQVFVDKILEHVPTSDQDQVKSEIYVHAKYFNTSELMPQSEINRKLNELESITFLTTYGIIGVGGGDGPPPDKAEDYLTAGLIIACCVIVVVIIIFVIAILVMRRKFNRDILVAKAGLEAAKDILEMKTGGGNSGVPTSNKFAGNENPLFDEVGDSKMTFDFISSETNDNDSIDDNEVDSPDSAISVENEDQAVMDDDQDLDAGAFEIDFGNTQNDNAKLAAALNAAHKEGENLTFLFDEVDDATMM